MTGDEDKDDQARVAGVKLVILKGAAVGGVEVAGVEGGPVDFEAEKRVISNGGGGCGLGIARGEV